MRAVCQSDTPLSFSHCGIRQSFARHRDLRECLNLRTDNKMNERWNLQNNLATFLANSPKSHLSHSPLCSFFNSWNSFK